MKEEDKYYTPTIEEFYVGFEFQQFDTWGAWKNVILTEQIIEGGGWISIGSGNERQRYYQNARVKYLDREDIESLGFKRNLSHKYSKVGAYERKTKHNNSIRIIKFSSIDLIRIELMLDPIINIVDKSQIFSGSIKNKSELVKLLKMLEI